MTGSVRPGRGTLGTQARTGLEWACARLEFLQHAIEEMPGMTLASVTVVGRNEALVAAWRMEFHAHPSVAVVQGSILESHANTLVSPANSFGLMDGGLDLALRDHFGTTVERAVREVIAARYHGELPVGLATIVETGHARHRYLITAPTMRFPGDVSRTVNAYLAMKATLQVAIAHPEPLGVAVPGFCAGTGGMSAGQVARQMRIAYERVVVGLHACGHWREELEFERYIRGDSPARPAGGAA
ncbi:MAG: macro domain-containing protein [Steroidobacteraceae bacterium]